MDTQFVSCGAILWDWEDREIPTHADVVEAAREWIESDAAADAVRDVSAWRGKTVANSKTRALGAAASQAEGAAHTIGSPVAGRHRKTVDSPIGRLRAYLSNSGEIGTEGVAGMNGTISMEAKGGEHADGESHPLASPRKHSMRSPPRHRHSRSGGSAAVEGDIADGPERGEERFLVRWRGLSLLHCSWETKQGLEGLVEYLADETDVSISAPRQIVRGLEDIPTSAGGWSPRDFLTEEELAGSVPRRVIAARLTMDAQQICIDSTMDISPVSLLECLASRK